MRVAWSHLAVRSGCTRTNPAAAYRCDAIGPAWGVIVPSPACKGAQQTNNSCDIVSHGRRVVVELEVASPYALPPPTADAGKSRLLMPIFGFGKRAQDEPQYQWPRVNARFCTQAFNGKYPHVGLYDCKERKVWCAKPLAGQAIRTSHARLITGADNEVRMGWK